MKRLSVKINKKHGRIEQLFALGVIFGIGCILFNCVNHGVVGLLIDGIKWRFLR